jgi:hypothetical protein
LENSLDLIFVNPSASGFWLLLLLPLNLTAPLLVKMLTLQIRSHSKNKLSRTNGDDEKSQ